MTHFDVLVIGTGSGNSILDDRFAHLKVAIAEPHLFGGTCLNEGCIPTKMYVHASDVGRQSADSSDLGLSTSFDGADWRAVRDRIFARIDEIESSGRRYRSHELENTTVLTEHLKFTGTHSLVGDRGTEVTADRIVIAAGASPVVPSVPGLDPAAVDAPGSPLHTSRTIMRIDEQPESLLVVGSGYIAMEFSHIFAGLGTRTTTAVRGDQLLGALDADISREFTAAFTADNDVRFGIELARVDVLGSGRVRVEFAATGRVPDAEVPEPIVVDRLLLAAGRTPNSAGLDAAAAGIDVHDDQRIAVDEHLRILSSGVPVPGVFALGDVCSPHQLKHVANHEATVAQANLLADIAAGAPGSARSEDLAVVNHHAVPAAVFTAPQVATVGQTEEEARATGAAVVVGRRDYAGVAYGWALEDRTGFAKVIADKSTRRILGAHIMGPEASMIIQPLIQAMAFDQTADEVATGQYWIHPALPEVVENALLDLDFS